MNHLVKRFLVLALPLLIVGSNSDDGYGIQIENNSGIELGDFSVTDSETEFTFGAISDGTQTGLGNADLQFGSQSPRKLEVAFTPRNGTDIIKSTVEIPILDKGESIKLSINSYLDLIDRVRS
ncbi:hypothetical protein [Mariniblastus fucicola]|uniref:Uncharacterized protein n=1 Tax=Mariniblastus fucicola TaxID=980251 RepID=A0A5B9PCQ0_9BACT|nr:hypothetical protein [Mariniblastus fucicola]QEG24044.1 hypothetical protein MFFC18_39550 [Mariniblastus fucicola]